MFTSDHTPELDPNFSTALDRAVEALRADFSLQLQEAKSEIQELRAHLQSPSTDTEPVRRRYESLGSSPDDLSALHYAVTQFDSSRTQAEILEAALTGCSRFASRAAVFVAQEGAVQGWGSYGFATEVKEISQTKLDLDSFPLFTELLGSDGSLMMTRADSSLLCEALGAEAAEQGVLIPIILSDNIVGALYADQLAESDSFNVLALQLLTHAAAQAIEALPARTRPSTATLYISSVATLTEDTPDPTPDMEPAEALVSEPDHFVETPDESIEIEEPFEAESEPAVEADIAESDEQLLEEVSDSLYVDSSEKELDEPAESSEPVEEITLEAEPSEVDETFGVEIVEDTDAEAQLGSSTAEESHEPVGAEEADEYVEPAGEGDDLISALDGDKDVDVTPPFESEASSSLVASESDVADSHLGSQDEPAGLDNAFPAAAAAEFAEETVYSEPSALEDNETIALEETTEDSEPDQVLELSESLDPDEQPSEPTALSDSAESTEADEPSDLYIEDYSTPDVSDSQNNAYDSEVSETSSSSASALQESHLQPTGEPSTIFSQTAGIPHIPAPGKASKEVAPPSGSEIAPPSDLDGPGWAFTASAPSGTSPEEAKQEEAKRLARLLITEIKLYNEEEVEEGRKSLDLTRRLGEEIERSRQIYDNRIEESIRSEADYFQEELVNILAGGDSEALS